MTPAARLQAAIELLDAIIVATREKGASADRVASAFFAARRYAGSKDRRAVRDLTWSAIRRFGERPESGRAAFVALAAADSELAGLFDGGGYGAAIITEDEKRAKGGVLPNWLLPLFSAVMGVDEHAALLDRAPLDIRVNTLLTSRDVARALLPEAEILAQTPNGLRLPTGFALDGHILLNTGQADIQDLGSQLIAQACEAAPGMTVLDLCAGAGGKTLALAAGMRGQGRLIAADTNRDRLAQLPQRAAKAQAANIETLLLNPGKEAAMLAELAGRCDLALVDAPCSGSGTWRRNPETRWRLDVRELLRLVSEQARILDIAAGLVREGGHLVYAVCSLLSAEGAAQVDDFLKRHSDWKAVDPAIAAGRVDGAGRLLTPAYDSCDGFYLARLQKL
jgi:16S rRNA (cytosine967-C5)-methyltransferase